jgi:diguanylate cyclase (GGDEF)-like protein
MQSPMNRLGDLLLSTDPLQRVRLAQALLAMGLMVAGMAAMHWFVWIGVAKARPVWIWTAVTLAGMAAFYGLIRSGWSRRLADPSMTVPQMVYSIASGALAYGLLGPGRGGVFPVLMVILMFGMFIATPSQMRAISLYAVALFGAVMGWMAWRDPGVYVPAIELGHFVMIATMLPAVSILAARLARMRARARKQRAELKEALARIRELATRDELTGLINRRHMQHLMEQEHRRCARSGQTFCLAVIDIDHFKPINDRHGHAGGDEVLRAVAQESLRHLRISDVLARWGGEEFVLMMPDTRAPLALAAAGRLRERIEALRVPLRGDEIGATLSIGLAEHRAGETVAQTLERADRALYEAKAQGRNRVVAAP